MSDRPTATAMRFATPPAPALERASNWESPPWDAVPTLELTHHMGQAPEHFPRVRARLGWDAAAIHVLFSVDDAFVRAVAPAHQHAVCNDSCVEFFFTPGRDVAAGYFNLEINCGGTILLHFQKVPRQDPAALPLEALAQIAVQRTLPRIVEPEIREPVTWAIECRLPYAVLEPWMSVVRPAAGVEWRANFFKCADDTSHPHWLTWAPVQRPKPDFHVPAAFGRLVFA